MFDTSRLTTAEREVLVDALDAYMIFLEKLMLSNSSRSAPASWKLFQARELRAELR